ncbi:MAG: DUF1036 domain-containing protein [Saprospiraceae bacterium]|nr:DUF1036 domain-containing protein [Lewinella sp.]
MGSKSASENFGNIIGWIAAIGIFFLCYSDTNDFGTAIVAAIIAGIAGYFVGKVVWITVAFALIVGWFIVRQVACNSVKEAIRTELSNEINNHETPTTVYTPSENNNIIEVNLKNNCNEKIYVAVSYQDNSDNWITSGWWTVDPYSSTKTNIRTSNPHLYFYANSDDGGEWTGEGDADAVTKKITSDKFTSRNNSGVYMWNKNVRNEVFFHRESDNYGVYTQWFTCD